LWETVARILDDCARFYAALKQVPGVKVYESAANFFLVRLDALDPVRLKERLAARAMHVRSRPDMPRHIRVTSLRPEENERLLEALGRDELNI